MDIRKIILAFALTVVSTSLYAGFTQPFPVEIDFENRAANGDMWSARISDNENMLIGCGSRQIQFGEEIVAFAFCQARVAEGEDGGVICNTFDPVMVAAINAIADYSFVTFNWNEEGECTRIGFSTQSFYLPKHKVKKDK